VSPTASRRRQPYAKKPRSLCGRDHHCSQSISMSADRWPNDVPLSEASQQFAHTSRSAQQRSMPSLPPHGSDRVDQTGKKKNKTGAGRACRYSERGGRFALGMAVTEVAEIRGSRITFGGWMTIRKENILAALTYLAECFPQAFVLERCRPHRPLKIGIAADLQARCPALEWRVLRVALAAYCCDQARRETSRTLEARISPKVISGG
jgi:hypothetical protein